ncbi:aromatic-ring-hydroxylating dioxygenase subunit beta [Sulfitobacter sp. PR48]|uniref:Aromatic-ring-hydroxylating dioxygenase subunit beta n=1 Tax=Sulfitobacter porphyrae TaxID=1246864 RepID=A0ABW2B9F7_9RHOB|nr:MULTISPECIES: aromatic-ring-hydroxylating dioxygenase subunit beta [unclassified Sulfitobacter]MCZ4257066.1 aromatic-ring-hydroxylating dioxygenase subunit beta [Sulfitobacter sp. G21635-S1]MDD9721124.1 aromatic-ring-hydroxylating dioxygenase subunit beta [Sulfitobacter sp. PR48]GLT10696.1 aromatic 1,2-dioxygenase subunit beta [Sulfitobacter porphyrae]
MNRDDLIDFVYDEAATIDQMRWDDWLALFHKDGRYWMPLEWQQEDPILQPSLMYEDRLLLTVRVERLAGERTFSQKPKSRCHHLMERPRILSMGEDGGVHRLRTSFIYTETRGDLLERYSGWVSHELVEVDGALQIKLKRIDLINFDAPFSNIQLFI